MPNYRDQQPNYDKQPTIDISHIDQQCWVGWTDIVNRLLEDVDNQSGNCIIAFDYYQGIDEHKYLEILKKTLPNISFFETKDALKSSDEIHEMVFPDVTDDRVFGFMSRFHLQDFFNHEKIEKLRKQINDSQGITLVFGYGAGMFAPKADLLVYADMARWEIQQRQRKNLINNLGAENKHESATATYKRSFFVDWRVLDRYKKELYNRWDFVIDANDNEQPKMIKGSTFNQAMAHAVQRPFRLVPFFDPGPWGGQWMREVCQLDPEPANFAWCFDCVPEENSMLLKVGDILFETPSINLVFQQPKALLGEPVYGRFGDEFPIRFDFLDTMAGGNLSLQVHPLTQYIQEHFGMHYTQDESYYLLDAAEDNATVYLGVKNNVDRQAMIDDLEKAQNEGVHFDAEKYVNKWPAKKHDHFLIPAGTVHCSGTDSMVLEISATPYIFTFKLWDWGRLGLDGKPRPINIKHGAKNIQWDRDTDWTRSNLINKIEPIAEGKGWKEERTGLHEAEFIETRRHWFTQTVYHETSGSVNVLNLVEGEEAIVESPTQAFQPFVVHYAETFVIPEAVGEYTISPYGKSIGKTCGTVKAFVRH